MKQTIPENKDAGIRKAVENKAGISVDALLVRIESLMSQTIKLDISKNDGTKELRMK